MNKFLLALLIGAMGTMSFTASADGYLESGLSDEAVEIFGELSDLELDLEGLFEDPNDWIEDNSDRVGFTAAQARVIADELDHATERDLPIGGTISVSDLINISANDFDNVGTADFDGTQVKVTYVNNSETFYDYTVEFKQIGIDVATPVFEDEDTTVYITAGVTRFSVEETNSGEGAGDNLFRVGVSVTEQLTKDTSVTFGISHNFDGSSKEGFVGVDESPDMGIATISIKHYQDIGDFRVGVSVGISANLLTGNKLAGVGMVSFEDGESGFFISPTSIGLIQDDKYGNRHELTLNPIGIVLNLIAGNPTVLDFIGDNEEDWAINK